PVPGPDVTLPTHRMPALQWRTWVRLAFVEAGSDWRSLNRLRIADGMLADYAIAPDTDWHPGILGVRRWDETSGVVAGQSSPTNGAFSVADPRFFGRENQQYGVRAWEDTSGAITAGTMPG